MYLGSYLFTFSNFIVLPAFAQAFLDKCEDNHSPLDLLIRRKGCLGLPYSKKNSQGHVDNTCVKKRNCETFLAIDTKNEVIDIEFVTTRKEHIDELCSDKNNAVELYMNGEVDPLEITVYCRNQCDAGSSEYRCSFDSNAFRDFSDVTFAILLSINPKDSKFGELSYYSWAQQGIRLAFFLETHIIEKCKEQKNNCFGYYTPSKDADKMKGVGPECIKTSECDYVIFFQKERTYILATIAGRMKPGTNALILYLAKNRSLKDKMTFLCLEQNATPNLYFNRSIMSPVRLQNTLGVFLVKRMPVHYTMTCEFQLNNGFSYMIDGKMQNMTLVDTYRVTLGLKKKSFAYEWETLATLDFSEEKCQTNINEAAAIPEEIPGSSSSWIFVLVGVIMGLSLIAVVGSVLIIFLFKRKKRYSIQENLTEKPEKNIQDSPFKLICDINRKGKLNPSRPQKAASTCEQ